MSQETAIDAAEAEEMHEAMDYAQHEKTWEGFTNLVKWSIIELAILVVALFCFIEGGVPWFGGLLILIGIVLPIIEAVRGPRR